MGTKIFSPNEQVRDTDKTLRWSLTLRKTFRQANLTIGETAAKIPTLPLSDRISILIFNNSTGGQILYLGDATVTTANGFPIYPRASIQIHIEDEIDVYGVSSAAGANIRIVEGS